MAMNPYDFPLYAAYAQAMLGQWNTGVGPSSRWSWDWDAVPPMGRMMVDVRVKDDGERGRRQGRKGRGLSRSRSRDDKDRARGRRRDCKSRRRSSKSRGRSRGGWYSSDEGRSRGRWWSRERGGCNGKRRIRHRNLARGDGLSDDDGEDAYDIDDDSGEWGPGRARKHKRHWWRGGRPRGERPRGEFYDVRDPGARISFKKMGTRLATVEDRLGYLEDMVQGTGQDARPSRRNPRFGAGYAPPEEFGAGDDFGFRGHGGRGRPSGGMGMSGRRGDGPSRRPRFGPKRDAMDDGGFEDEGFDFGLGGEDAMQNWSSNPQGAPYPPGKPTHRPKPTSQDNGFRPPAHARKHGLRPPEVAHHLHHSLPPQDPPVHSPLPPTHTYQPTHSPDYQPSFMPPQHHPSAPSTHARPSRVATPPPGSQVPPPDGFDAPPPPLPDTPVPPAPPVPPGFQAGLDVLRDMYGRPPPGEELYEDPPPRSANGHAIGRPTPGTGVELPYPPDFIPEPNAFGADRDVGSRRVEDLGEPGEGAE
ncbi:MAG: hypothetical protein M1820_001790 [Bogoriella megaspora]|nr:MAG: hypothetical protein M1820_001790 [Bogoriella megaspora]